MPPTSVNAAEKKYTAAVNRLKEKLIWAKYLTTEQKEYEEDDDWMRGNSAF